MSINNFDVIKRMCEQDLDIKSFTGGNVTHIRTGKDGWGRLEIAIDNATASSLMSEQRLNVMLLAFDVNEFKALKAEMEKGEKE